MTATAGTSAVPLVSSGGGVDQADRDDAAAIAAVIAGSYVRALHPARDPGFVRASLDAGDPWFVYREDDRVVACLSGARLPWTGVREFRFMAVLPRTRHHGVAVDIAAAGLRWVTAQPDCELLFARSRQAAVTHMGETAEVHTMAVIGHDGGVEFADGRREIHLLMGNVNQQNLPLRAATDPGSSASRSYAEVAWSSRPPERSVAPLSEHVLAPQAAEWWSDDFGYLRDGDADLPAIGGTRRAAVAEVTRLVRRHDARGLRHLSAVVPATKTEFLADLAGLGFRRTAYLPAWYREGVVRHDCVLLTRSDGQAATNGQDHHIQRWNRILEPVVESGRAPGAPSGTS